MKLANLKVCGIRGFNLEREINLDDGLTVIYGPNGQGKTSFVEAIEWLLFGTIFKKDKAPSKIEYRNTIKNFHFSDGTPYVEAIFNNGDGLVKMRREYIDEERSRLFINDASVRDVCKIGISDNIRPIIYQHGLKSFIHTEPMGRRMEFMKLLNIDDVDTFFGTVRNAQNEYRKNKPKKIIDAFVFLQSIEKDLPEYHEILISTKFNILKASIKINTELNILDSEINEDNFAKFVVSVKELEEKTRKELFDLEIFSPIHSFESFEPNFLDKPEITASVELLMNPDVAFAKSRLDVLKNGLQIIETTKTDECPLCFEKTIDEDKIKFIKSKYREDEKFEKQIKKAQKEMKSFLTQLSKFRLEHFNLLSQMIIEEQKIRVCEKFGIKKSSIEDFLGKTKALNGKYQEAVSNFDFLEKILENIQNNIVEDKTLENFKINLDNLKKNIQSINKIVDDLSNATANIRVDLEKKISSSEKVKRIEKLSSILQNLKTFEILKANAKIESNLTESLAKLKEYRDKLLDRMLSAHKSKIIEWYDVLNPSEDIRICDIDCHKDKVDFIVTSYGVKGQAVPILSEAHLNCLGLSIYLSKIVNPDNPFSFIFIDDPVQSMDDMHTDNFINNILENLMKENYQVFILSHLRSKVYEQILYRYKEKTPTAIEFYGCTKEGPNIKINAERFDGYISLAEQNYNGDVEQRKTAANLIRQALEAYTKEYYSKKSGEDVPATYKNKTFSVLDEKLLSRVPIDGNERGRLRLIGRNCDIGSHDDQRSEPPTSPELRSYIDTLKGLYRKHIKGLT